MREFLRGLEFDDETIDCIMAEYGKLVTKDKEELQNLKGQILELQSEVGVDWRDKYQTLKAQEQDTMINNILNGKEFVNDYTKNAIVNELRDELNKGGDKKVEDVFNEITKGKEGIFVSKNQSIDMPEIQDFDGPITKEMFDKMGYNDRLTFKQNNPALFAKYNN